MSHSFSEVHSDCDTEREIEARNRLTEALREENEILRRAFCWFRHYPELTPNPWRRKEWLQDIDRARPLVGEPSKRPPADEGPWELDEIIKLHCAKALKATKGNITNAAKLMKLSRRTMHRYLDRWPDIQA